MRNELRVLHPIKTMRVLGSIGEMIYKSQLMIIHRDENCTHIQTSLSYFYKEKTNLSTLFLLNLNLNTPLNF